MHRPDEAERVVCFGVVVVLLYQHHSVRQGRSPLSSLLGLGLKMESCEQVITVSCDAVGIHRQDFDRVYETRTPRAMKAVVMAIVVMRDKLQMSYPEIASVPAFGKRHHTWACDNYKRACRKSCPKKILEQYEAALKKSADPEDLPYVVPSRRPELAMRQIADRLEQRMMSASSAASHLRHAARLFENKGK